GCADAAPRRVSGRGPSQHPAGRAASSSTGVGENHRVPRLLADLTPLRISVPFRRMWLGASLSGIGTSLTSVDVGLQVYDLTGRTEAVGLVEIAGLLPLVLLGLYGGAISDAHDLRVVILVTAAGLLGVAVLLAAQAFAGVADVRVLYALVALQNGLYALNSPARSATVPKLVGL